MNKVSRRGILSHGELNLILLWAARQSAEENVPAVSRVCLAQVANTCNPFTGSVDRLGPHRLWLRSTFDEIPRVRQFSSNLGPIWVWYAGSKNSLEDQ